MEPSEAQEIKESEIGLSNNFSNLDPYEFEEFIAKLFRAMGYEAHKTTSTGDFGADVIAKKVKRKLLFRLKNTMRGTLLTP